MKSKPQKSSKSKKKMKFTWKDFILYGALVVFFLIFTFGFGGITGSNKSESIPLSKVIADIKQKKVEAIEVAGASLTVTYANGDTAKSRKEQNASFYEVLQNAGVDPTTVNISIKDDSGFNTWIGILSSLLPVLLLVGFFYFIMRQARGAQESIFSFGSNKGKTFNKDFPKVTFDSVAGVDEAKQELTEIVDFLKNPQKYQAMGARTPKGVLLVGPAGTGKTLLARAVAGEAQVPFISIAGSEFMEMLVGVGAARVRDLFATSKKNQPAIIFIDEVDAIGRQRGGGLMGGHDEREQTLNQILVEMDGFTPNEQLVVMAATNRPDILDPALVRPGRFDRRIMIGLPDLEGRLEILKIHAKGKPFTKNIDWERIARRTVQYSGADLENMLNEAAILAARESVKEISITHVEEAATKVKMGPEKRRMQTDEDKKITAYHEAGHALVSYYMPNTDPVHTISIVSRGMSLGHTLIPPAQDRVHETKTRLLEIISTMLGGRAAEELIYNEMTTGAGDDIQKATHLARNMVVDYGMSSLGPVQYDIERSHMYEEGAGVSDVMQAKIDAEVHAIIEARYKIAMETLKKYKNKLDDVALELVKKEKLEGDEFDAIMKSDVKKTVKKTSKSGKK
jgi:cell division protease FtsH